MPEPLSSLRPASPAGYVAPRFTCPRCGLSSGNPEDILWRWCVACHTAFDELGQPCVDRHSLT